MKTSTLKRLAWILNGLTITGALVGIIVILYYTPEFEGATGGTTTDALYPWIAGFTIFSYLVLSNLILSRNPRHVIGWLFLLVGFFLGAQVAGLTVDAIPAVASSRPGRIVEVLSGDIWVPSFLIPITLILQFFPDGRLPSRRWWPVTVAAILGMLAIYLGFILHPWPWPESNIDECCNPLAVHAGARFFDALDAIAGIFIILGVLGSLASVLARFRRSEGIERAQMKWLVYIALVVLSAMVMISLLGYDETPLFGLFFLLIPALFAGVLAMAILRYRLFDIDVLIRRTLQYAILSAILALVYFGGVVMLQTIFDVVVGQHDSPLITVVSTLTIAALFNPLRLRIQDFIDQRFYRKKYDAERALAQFATSARDEVDVDRLAAALLDTVEETVQPDRAALWLHDPRASR